MIPLSFSATALKTASGCMSRYKAEVIDRGANFQNSAAGVGIVLHGTLENYIRAVFIRKDMTWSEDNFFKVFHLEFDKQFGADRKTPEYEDAKDIATRWFHDPINEEDLECNKILSLESKNNFLVPTSAGKIPVNYIMDRVERLPNGDIKVIDYKTNRFALTSEQLSNEIQAKLYALAMQIIYKEAKIIWVEFQYLRHRSVCVGFTRENNAETWRMIKRMAQEIVDMSEEDAEKKETLNAQCGFCVKKATCKALTSNVRVGGIHSMSDGELASRLAKIGDQQRALTGLKAELEAKLLAIMIKSQLTVLDTDEATIKLSVGGKRVLNHAQVPTVIGSELANELGQFTLQKIDVLLKGNRISETQKALLKNLITFEQGEPKISVSQK